MYETQSDLQTSDMSLVDLERVVCLGATAKRELVKRFYDRMDMPITDVLNQIPGGLSPFENRALQETARGLQHMAGILLEEFERSHSVRCLRAHLIVEEVAEFCDALERQDLDAVFDAICDIDYVNTGTAMTYQLPVGAGFCEVQRSNMTKTRNSDDPALRKDKGEEFSPPNLRLLRTLYQQPQLQENTDDHN